MGAYLLLAIRVIRTGLLDEAWASECCLPSGQPDVS